MVSQVTALTYLADYVEELVTAHPDTVVSTKSASTQDTVESTDWDAQLRRDSCVGGHPTDPVEIASPLPPINLAVRNVVPSGLGLSTSKDTKSILYVHPYNHYLL